MLLSAILALSIAAQPQTVSDYFPITPGSKWTFTQESEGTKDQVIYSALPAVKVGKDMAVPMEQATSGGSMTSYYKVEALTLYLVGTDPTKPFPDPWPLIRLNTPSNKWRWDYLQSSEPVNVDAELKDLGKRTVLGAPHDAIEVVAIAKFGNVGELKITQTISYAKGIGIYLIDTEQQMGRNHHRAIQTLTKYEPGRS